MVAEADGPRSRRRGPVFRWFGVALWLGAAVQVGRLGHLLLTGVASDVPLLWGEATGLLDRGSALGVSAALAAAAGALVWRMAVSSPRELRVYAAAAAVLVAGQAGVWWAQRIEPLPDLAASQDARIPGAVAWAEQGDGEVCLAVVAASGGTPRVPYCEPEEYAMDFVSGGWFADGLLAFYRTGAVDQMLVIVDVETGAIVDAYPGSWTFSPVRMGTWERADGAVLVTDGRRVLIQSPDGDRDEVIALRGPHDYWIDQAGWSPDGRWILLRDSRDRIIIAAATGDDPRLLAERPRSYGPVWHITGVPTYTVSEPTLPPADQYCSGYREASLACRYRGSASDMTAAAARALLLVMDDEFLVDAVLDGVETERVAAVTASTAANLELLAGLAERHGFSELVDPWRGSAIFPVESGPFACVMAADIVRSEFHLLDAVAGEVAGSDLEGAFAMVRADLVARLAALDDCSRG